MKVAVIGAGAAGYFAAISVKAHHPNSEVFLFEKTNKVLAKVRVSGGGRCNVTHHCLNNRLLAENYPRGQKFLKTAFDQFNVSDTIGWYESRGVKLKTDSDNRMFPESDSSESIRKCLMDEALNLKVQLSLNQHIMSIDWCAKEWVLTFGKGEEKVDCIIVATGGSPKRQGLKWLEDLGHQVVEPQPSLFSFNMPNEPIRELMGVSVQQAEVRLVGSKLKANGPLLITHWGMSGPAILKLSAFGARVLSDKNYDFSCQVNWLGNTNEHELREIFDNVLKEVGNRQIGNKNPFELPTRLWEYLVTKSSISLSKPWRDLPKKELNRLINTLFNDTYEIRGKTTFKEEFVTAGGVALDDIDPDTMKSKVCPNLYFAGEVMDIDGITGGFNFQAAWTTGFIAGKLGGR